MLVSRCVKAAVAILRAWRARELSRTAYLNQNALLKGWYQLLHKPSQLLKLFDYPSNIHDRACVWILGSQGATFTLARKMIISC